MNYDHVTLAETMKFLEGACRNWKSAEFDKDGAEDVRVELQRFLGSRREAPLGPSVDLLERSAVMDAVMIAMAEALEAKGVSIVATVIDAINRIEAVSPAATEEAKLRDWFAGQALTAMPHIGCGADLNFAEIAHDAYSLSDALLAMRKSTAA